MKLRAVRLSEVGHFRTGVALEGLSGGLDVVAGPNEAGKSTIFRAIETVFGYPHSSGHRDVHALQPVMGGAPLIEVDFETDGRTWRLRKRYLAARSVQLVDLGNSVVLRGADAENQLDQLVAGRLGRRSMLKLLWVGQDKVLRPIDDRPGEVPKSIGRLIEDEIADASGEGVARRVREVVAAALDGLVSKANRKPKAGTPYKAAIDARDRARAELDQAEGDAQAAATRLAELKAVQARAAELAAPEPAATRAARLAALRKSLDDGNRAEEGWKLASLVVEKLQAAHDLARDERSRLAAAIDEAARLRHQIATARAGLAAAAGEVESRSTERRSIQARRADADARAQDAQALIEACDRHERHRAATAAVADLLRRSASASADAARIAEIDTALAAEPVTEKIAAEMRRKQSEIESLRARLAAALPRVRIDYAAGAEGRISIAGNAIAGSGDVAPAAALILDIAGIGRVTVSAPAVAGDDTAERLAAALERLRAMLKAANVADIAAAEARLEARQQLAAEHNAIAGRLTAVAPQGLAALERQRAQAEADVRALAPIVATDLPPKPRAQLAQELSDLRVAIAQLDAAERAGQDALLEASRRHSRLQSELAIAEAGLAKIEAALPPSAQCDAELAAASARLAAAEAEFNTAVRERGGWAAGRLAAAARAALEADIAAAVRAETQNQEERQRVALAIKGLESALLRDRQDGVEVAVEEARAAFDVAQARVAAFEREVEELALLGRLLEEEEQATRATELRPVVDRLQLYARGVFPQATFALADRLVVSGLARQGVSLAAERLSGGTSEQIAILVRLAYARLLADRGEGLPLVLDDPLVYADEVRFEAMFAALELAAEHHQVIMLTCHQGRIADLGGRPRVAVVGMTPWTPADNVLAGLT